ncbi:MAG: hypothetical protein F6K42_07570 [Leptolyngbya sp. SIO1D8]|nr:hypothetical protein [Leptolyngbya sp. SIO1D8]
MKTNIEMDDVLKVTGLETTEKVIELALKNAGVNQTARSKAFRVEIAFPRQSRHHENQRMILIDSSIWIDYTDVLIRISTIYGVPDSKQNSNKKTLA